MIQISDTDKDELNKILEDYNIKTPLDKFPQIQGTTRPKFKMNTDSRKNISKQNTLENRIAGQDPFGVAQEPNEEMRENMGKKYRHVRH